MTLLRNLVACVFLVLAFAANGTALQTESQNEKQKQDEIDATEGSKNMNEVVQHPMDALQRALKLSMETYGFEIKKEELDYLEGTRSRHIGVFLGSGGEKVTVKLSQETSGIRVKVETGKGFIGRLGKKNWSTPIFNEAMKILASSQAGSPKE